MFYLSSILYEKSKKIGILLNIKQQKKILKYIFILQKWNKIYNLTSVKKNNKILDYHILDSLIATKMIKNINFLLDVGTGAGFPGIIIAIFLENFSPNTQIHLIESKNKKIAFLTQVSLELKLKNVYIYHSRVENFKKNFFYDVIISRGLCKIKKFILYSKHLLKINGYFLAMKTIFSKKEINNIPIKWFIKKILSFKIPNINKNHFIIKILKNKIC